MPTVPFVAAHSAIVLPTEGSVVINRLDEAEPARMSGIDFERIARIVSVEAEWRDQQRAVDAYSIHRTYHLVAGDRRRPCDCPAQGRPEWFPV